MQQASDFPRILRPRVARKWALALGIAALVASIALAIFVAGPHTLLIDRVGILAFGAVIMWFCYRQASVCVEATEAGVRIRNIFSTAHFTWEELFSVSFPVGDAWAHVNLSNGETHSVMAIQRADSAFGVAQARELNALIQRHGTAQHAPESELI